MLIISQTALELGFMYALVAMALFLSYRILDIADMTTDGCFVLGAAVSVTLSAAGHPFLALPAAMLAGACAGFVVFADASRRPVDTRRYSHEHRALYDKPHGHGLEVEFQSTRRHDDIHPPA